MWGIGWAARLYSRSRGPSRGSNARSSREYIPASRAADAPQLWKLTLVETSSPQQIVVRHSALLAAHAENIPLELSSHPGLSIMISCDCIIDEGPCRGSHVLHVGVTREPLKVSYDGVFMTDSATGKVFDIDMDHLWIYRTGGYIWLLNDERGTREQGGGRDWMINENGTVSPVHAPNLILGVGMDVADIHEERMFLSLVLHRLMALSFFHVASMPITYAVAHWSLVGAYCVIGCKFIASHALQRCVIRNFEEWIRTRPHDGLDHLVHRIDCLEPRWPSSGACSCLLQFGLLKMMRFIKQVAGLFEAIDPDFDVLTASVSFVALTDKQISQFALEWKETWVLGVIVVYLGLPGILAVIIIIALATQVKSAFTSYIHASWCIRYWPGSDLARDSSTDTPNARLCTIALLHHLADVCGLLEIQAWLGEMWRAEWHGGYNRAASFLSRYVLEAGLSAWFNVSFLGFVLNTATRTTLASSALSLMSSVCTLIKGIFVMAPEVMRFVRQGDRELYMYYGPLLVVAALLFLAIMVHMIGLWSCPSHMLNLISGCVPIAMG